MEVNRGKGSGKCTGREGGRERERERERDMKSFTDVLIDQSRSKPYKTLLTEKLLANYKAFYQHINDSNTIMRSML